jgi:serine/threonine protein phosphatase PrpC
VTQALLELPIVYGLDDLVASAVEALKKVNRDLIALAGSSEGQRTIGSTVVGIAIANGQFRCFWAGDSRAYRIRDGAIERLSRDHSLVQSLVDAGMLAPDEAESHPNANVITRAVGVAEELTIDVVDGDARVGDLFLLASDGLTRPMSDSEIAAALVANPPAIAAGKMVDTVLSRGAPDNVSMIIVKIIG